MAIFNHAIKCSLRKKRSGLQKKLALYLYTSVIKICWIQLFPILRNKFCCYLENFLENSAPVVHFTKFCWHGGLVNRFIKHVGCIARRGNFFLLFINHNSIFSFFFIMGQNFEHTVFKLPIELCVNIFSLMLLYLWQKLA